MSSSPVKQQQHSHRRKDSGTAAVAKVSQVTEVTKPNWVREGAKYPWEIGCKCDVCYLGEEHRKSGGWRPVMPEVNPNAEALVLAENPGKTEVASGRPLTGKSGKEAETGLFTLGLRREQFSWDNAALCIPTGADTKMMLADMARENRKLAAKGQPVWLSPFVACQPHVTSHVLSLPKVLAFGKYSVGALTGKSSALRKIRGSMMDLWTAPDPSVDLDDPDQTARPQIRPNGIPIYVKNVRVPGPGDLPLYADETLPPTGSQRIQVVPTLHPAFVLRYPAWRPAFQQDIGRFWRWIHNELRWEVPTFKFRPSAAELADFLYGPSSGPMLAVDIETDGKESLTANLRCIAIARPEGGMVIPFLGTQRAANRWGRVPATPYTPINQAERMAGRAVFSNHWATSRGCFNYASTYYSDQEAYAVLNLVKHFLLDQTKVKVGHNFGYFDNAVLMRELDLPVEPSPLVDTILYFRGAHSELYRDLFTLGTIYTDVPDWKAASDERKIAVNPRDDIELARYANTDTTVDIRVAPQLIQEVALRGQTESVRMDHQVQSIYREAHQLGMRLDEPRRMAMEETHAAEEESLTKMIRDTLGDPNFNPYSTRQLTRLMFTDWNLPVLFRTDTGEPAADDDTLREIIAQKVLSSDRLNVIKLIRRLRKVKKELSTYLLPWRRWNDYRRMKVVPEEVEVDFTDIRTGKKKRRVQAPVDDDDLEWDRDLKGGLCFPDGRIHPHYNVHTAKTGRTSSSVPNLQNVAKHLRELFIPEGGNLYTGLDFDQIELRLVAALARLERYIVTIQKGGDPHALTAELLYGDTFLYELRLSYSDLEWETYQRTGIPTKASGKRATAKYISMRTLAKSFIYAVIYGGSARTIFDSVSSAEDEKTGEPLFPDMTYSEIQRVYNNFMEGLPELYKWWDKAWTFAMVNFHVCEPIGNRRRDFPAFERNEIPNMLIQGSAGIIMSRGLIKIREKYAPNFDLRRGIVNQCHDHAVLEHGRHEAGWVREMMTECMTQRYLDMDFTGVAESSEDWAHT